MYKILRAAGFAAAAFGAAASPALADPSQAFVLESKAPQPSVEKHDAPFSDLSTASTISPAEPALVQAEPLLPPQNQLALPPVVELPTIETDEEKPSKRSLLSLVDQFQTAKASNAELECLAGAIYFESKGEPLAGQLAVAEVIINRSKSGRYPTTMCGVVKQRGQFSFIRGGRFPAIPKSSPQWRKAVAIAHIALEDLADSPARDALSFHATYVSPRWRMKRVATVGNHIFYR